MSAVRLKPLPMMRSGLAVDFGGGHIYTVPPLALGDVEMLQERLAALADQPMTSIDSVATVIEVAHRALCRNYLCSRDQVADIIDVGNMPQVLEAVLDVGGLRRRAQQQATAGNAPAPAETGTAGAPSTPESPATPAG